MVRQVIVDGEGSIYFRGGGGYEVSQFEDWTRQQSYYTRHGDRFVILSVLLSLIAVGFGYRRPIDTVAA
jgi:hypothetical protein